MKNDIAYAHADFIPDGDLYPDRWEADARAHREREAAIGRARFGQARKQEPLSEWGPIQLGDDT